MISLGIDPDTNSTGFALVDDTRGPLALGCLPNSGELRGRKAALHQIAEIRKLSGLPALPDIVVVEYQEHYAGKGKANPNHLMLLSMITGAGLCIFHDGFTKMFAPYPKEWKGSVPKGIHQKRILSKLGWEFKDNGKKLAPTPVFPDLPVIGDIEAGAKEVVDAIGLAQWGLKQVAHDLQAEKRAML